MIAAGRIRFHLTFFDHMLQRWHRGCARARIDSIR